MYSSDGIIRIWSMETGNRLFTIETKGMKVEFMKWDEDDPNKIFCATTLSIYIASNKEGTFVQLPIGDRLPRGSRLTAIEQCKFQSNLIAVGYDGGNSNEGIIYLHNTATKTTSRQKLVSHVMTLSWDPCSSDFILMLLKSGNLLLYDITNGREVSEFTKQPIGSTSAAFFIGKTCPGSFVTCSSRGDVLKLWNVAQTTFMKSLKIGIAADLRTALFVSRQNSYPKEARIMATFTNGAVALYSPTKEKLLWNTTGGHTETVFACDFRSTDVNTLATSSYDQSIRIWDISSQPEPSCKAVLPRVTSTIYSLCWSADGVYIACGTANGEVVFYEVDKHLLVSKVQAHSEPCFCVQWNTFDTRLIASAGQDSKCVIMTMEGEIIQNVQHPDACFGVAWDPFNRCRLATSCEDKLFYLWTLVQPNCSGDDSFLNEIQVKKVNQFKGHNAKVFSVVWNKKIKDLVATGSDDGTVRIWSLNHMAITQTDSNASKNDVPLKLSSGVLSGHKSRVRGLLWHKDAPWLLITSSWDATVRLWDTISMTCIQILDAHHSDVYGVSMHPERPFVIATTSRDTTVRIWNLIGNSFDSLQHLPLSIWMKFVLNKTIDEKTEDLSHVSSIQRNFNLKAIEQLCSNLSLADSEAVDASMPGLELLLDYWWPSSRVKHLFDAAKVILCSRSQSRTQAVISETAESHLNNLVKYVEGQSSSFIDILLHYQNVHMCMHSKVAFKLLQVEAQYLESFKRNKFMGVGMGKGKREIYTREAAKLYLRSGNIMSYCEIMCELEEWDKALALAPMVGQTYWKELMKRKAKACASTHHQNEGDAFKDTSATVQDSEAYLIAGHEIDSLVEMYRGLGDDESAFLIASVASEGGYGFDKQNDEDGKNPSSMQGSPESQPVDILFQPLRRKSLAPLTRPPGAIQDNPPDSPGILGTAKSHSKSHNPVHTNFRNTMYDIQSKNAKKYKADGDSITAACCRLSVNDVQGCINALLMGMEFELALILSYYLLEKDDPTSQSVVRLQIMKLEALGQFSLARGLFELFGSDCSSELEFHNLRKQLVMKNQPFMNGNSETQEKGGESVEEEMKALLHAQKHEKCASKFLEYVEKIFAKPFWSMEEDIDAIWKYANCISCDNIGVDLKKKFMCYIFLISSLKFMWRNQCYLCAHAYGIFLELVTLPHISFPRDFEVSMKLQLLNYLCQSSQPLVRSLGRMHMKELGGSQVPDSLRAIVAHSVEQFATGGYIPLPSSPDHRIVPSGSTLPTIEQTQKSLFKTFMRASQSLKLEDGINCISLGEAIAWKNVCNFSPLSTGKHLKLSA